MTPDEALEEAQRATVAFHIALAKLGVETIEEAIALFRRLNTSDIAGTATGWLDDAISMVMTRRDRSQELALAYYRLFRALRTGTTIPDPRDPEPAYVTLDDLRGEFEELLDSAGVGDEDIPEQDVHSPEPDPYEGRWTDENGDTVEADPDGESDPPDEIPDEIPIDPEWAGADDSTAELIEELTRQDEYSEQIIEDLLTEIVNDVKADLEDADRAEKRNPERAEKKREKVRENARQAAAGYAQLVTLNAARGALTYMHRSDRRAIGYVRVSRTGTPCHFCAMLIGRGVVYKSAQSAGGGFYDKGDEYHANCQCFALPIFFMRDYESMELFDMNRKLGKEWRDGPTAADWDGADRTSNPALTAWRRYWTRRKKELEAA